MMYNGSKKFPQRDWKTEANPKQVATLRKPDIVMVAHAYSSMNPFCYPPSKKRACHACGRCTQFGRMCKSRLTADKKQKHKSVKMPHSVK